MNKVLIIIICCLSFYGCAGWKINGIPAEQFKPKNMTFEKVAQLSAGIVTSFVIHWASHVAVIEYMGYDWKQEGFNEVVYNVTDGDAAWIGRAGFLGQLLGGFLLKTSPYSESYFATGYHIGTSAEIMSYPIRHNGDLGLIGRNSSAGSEWAIYSGVSLLLLAPSTKP